MDDLRVAQQCAHEMFVADRASQMLGMSIEIPAPGEAIATMRVDQNMINGFDVCHGGIIFALADSAFAFACNAYNRVSVAAAANIDFLRPVVLNDVLTATAREDHRGRRSGLYSVDVVNQDGECVALFRGRSVTRDETLIAGSQS